MSRLVISRILGKLRPTLWCLASGVLACAAPHAMGASAIYVTGHGPWGDFTSTISYQYNAGTTVDASGKIVAIPDLAISLTNISNPENGGYITGFVFNVLGDAVAKLDPNPQDVDGNLTTWTDKFWDVIAPEKASPFDPFEAGAALTKKSGDGEFLGPGNPTSGISVGKSATFTFNVTGRDADKLTAMSFVSERSYADGISAGLLVRFMGFNNGQSNKSSDNSITIIPLSSSVWSGMVLLGGLAAAYYVRYRRMA